MIAKPVCNDLDRFISLVKQTYFDMFWTEISDEAVEAADDVFHGAELEEYRDDLSAGEYDAIDLNMKY